MCLGIPGKIVETYHAHGARMAKVDFGGIQKEVCLAYVPQVEIGDYTIVHVGFAITKLDEESAQKSLALFRELGVLAEELGVEDSNLELIY
jgi:hydrogenase expression/formation protein HypC